MDLGGNWWPPTYSTGLKHGFPPWQFFYSFLVLNFWGRFKALKNVFWAYHSQSLRFSQSVMEKYVVLR
jgi:hypothetical protein